MERISLIFVLTASLFFLAALSSLLYLRVRKCSREYSFLEAACSSLQAQNSEALGSIKKYYHALLDQIPAGIIIIGKSAKITYSNAAAERLLATKKKDLMKVPLSRFAVNFELSKRLTEALGGKEVEREIKITRPKERILKARISPIRESGLVQGAVVVLEDVTKLRRLEKARQELVSSFSHELRTPIASCQAALEALLEWKADRDPKEREKFLKNLSQQMEHLSSLVTKMLQLTRLESGSSIVRKEKAQATNLVDKALETVEVLAQTKGVKLERRVPEDVFVKVDQELFVQTLINLLDNAIKYTNKDGVVRIEVEEVDSRVVFRVADTGRGIPQDSLPRIFERFYRVDKHRSREKGGSGLGLALTKHIVEAHKGKINAESSPSEGSVFTISIKKA